MRTFLQDLRYGARMLLKHPGLTLIAVLSLALGIGANSAIFSLLDAVLLKTLPVKNPEQFVLLSRSHPQGSKLSSNISYPVFAQLREQNHVCAGMFTVLDFVRLNASVNGQAEMVEGQLVSGSFHSVLGVKAVLGRTFSADDDQVPGANPVAVISDGYWQRRFARDPAVIGKSIILNGAPFTIVGVTPPEFFGVTVGVSPDISLPLAMLAQAIPGETAPAESYRHDALPHILARLNPGVTPQQASAALTLLLQQSLRAEAGSQWSPEREQDFQQQRIELTPGSQGLSGLRRQFYEPLRLLSAPLGVLMAVVGLVLLIACANVANLLLARATARRKEIAVRLALGAGRLRLIRQLLTESALLALLGGALGLLFAYWGNDLLLTLISSGRRPLLLQLAPDARMLGFTAAVSLLASLLFGLAPALRATRVDLTPALKDSPRMPGRGSSRFKLSQALVVAQVALSLVLLIGAGLFVRSLLKLQSLDVGFEQEKVLFLSVDPKLIGYQRPQIADLYRRVLERIAAIPGVRSASLSRNSLLSGGRIEGAISLPGSTSMSDESRWVRRDAVGPRFFETVGMPLLMGRDFNAQDNERAPQVAVINETCSRAYFGHESPLGKRFGWEPEQSSEIEIVGVVKDAKYHSLREETPRMIYLPYLQDSGAWRETNLQVRTANDPLSMAAAIRRELQAIDPNLPVFGVKTLKAQVNESLAQERLVATLSGFFGMLALLMACVGLYGVLSFTVSQRTAEIGIRMALGAQRGNVLWLVMRETLLLILIGIAVGLSAALATTRLTASLLFGLAPTDLVTVSLATLLMIMVGALSGYLPARRATKVDPMIALRCE